MKPDYKAVVEYATPAQENKILNNWFRFMAMQYSKLAKKYGVDLFTYSEGEPI